MSLTISYSNPVFPEGTEMSIADLAVVPNGGSVELSEEQQEMFKSARGMAVQDALADDPNFAVKGKAATKTDEGTEGGGES